jgi:MFS transporter, FSR family, fosmidomycin resistance protein
VKLNKSIFRLNNIGHGINDLYWFLLPLILPMLLSQFDLNYSIGGSIITLYLMIAAVSAVILGRLSDRFSYASLTIPGFLVIGAGILLSGLVKNFTLLIVALSIAAIGVGSFHPVGYAMISRSAPERQGWAFSLFEIWGSIFLLGMYVVHGTLLQYVGWKAILLLSSIPGFIMVLLIIRTGRRCPELKEHAPTGKQSKSARIDGQAPVVVYLLLFISIFLRIIAITGVFSFIPTYFINEIAIQKNFAAYISGLYFMGGIAGSVIAGWASSRVRGGSLLLVFTILMVPFTFLLGIALPTGVYAVIIFMLGAVSAASGVPQNLLVSRLSGKTGDGRIFGWVMGVITVTSSFSPALFGMIADSRGMRMSFKMFTLPALASFAILLVLLYHGRFKRYVS